MTSAAFDTPFPSAHHRHDAVWLDEQFARLPGAVLETVSGTYSRVYEQQGRQAANLYMLEVGDLTRNKSLLAYADESLKLKAERLALLGAQLKQQTVQSEHSEAYKAAERFFSSAQVNRPTTSDPSGFVARAACPDWWWRQLKRKQDRQLEQLAIQLGQVTKHRQAYVSNDSLARVQSRLQASLAVLERFEAVSEDGEAVDLLEVLKHSVANPAVRRAELMVRMRGFEDYATTEGHSALFYTLTCPSRFHRYSGAKLNPNYDHSTPRQAQAYLSRVWARIRSQLKRDGINPYGFRVAEPHTDGTPHWHILLFVKAHQAERLTSVMRVHALADSGTEPGAAEHRFTVKAIDPKRGSATGYIAKYISKNIDGFGLEHDEEADTPAQEGAQRVRAWASVWGIRQFQQIGGAPVGVWRELRRMEQHADELLEQARLAADSSDWAAYLVTQGGADMDRKDQLFRGYSCEVVKGEVQVNRYGETVKKLVGIRYPAGTVETRVKQWTIQVKGEAQVCPSLAECVPASTGSAFAALDFLQAARPIIFPWSTVNNCTQGTESVPEEEPDRPKVPVFYSDEERANWQEWRKWYADNGMDRPGSRYERLERAAIVLESLEALQDGGATQ